MTDQDTFALKPLLEADASDEFVAAFRGIMEWTGASGRRRYPYSVIRKLAEALAGRNFGPLVFQLCHFIPAAGSVAGRREGYWGLLHGIDRASANQFRVLFGSRMEECPSATLEMDPVGLTWTGGGAPFKVWFRAMPLLSALHDFLWTEVPDARAAFDELAGVTQKPATGEFANRVQRALDAYLNVHQLMRQSTRKMQRVREFLVARAKDRTADIGDEEVFEFWRQHAEDGGGDFAKFRSALSAITHFLSIRARADRRGDVGLDPDILGGIDADDPLAVDPDWESPLSEFEDPASSRKYFGSGENRRRVARVAEMGPVVLGLPLSALRAEVFGDKQERLSNALRQRLRASEIASCIADSSDGDYRQRRQVIAGVLAALQGILPGAAWEAHTAGDGPDSGVTESNVIGFPGAAQRDVRELDEQELEAALAAAEETFLQLRHQRSAWRADLDSSEESEKPQKAFARLGALVQLRALLRQFLEQVDGLDQADHDLEALYAEDHGQFGAVFTQMYGAGR